MSTSSLFQSSLNERKKTITTTTTTTCTRTLFSKLSTTTTSSTSSLSSIMNDVMMTPNMQQTINPFEETNKFRLEQSVLSPNLFQIASTSTPERENTNSMWNIEQRAVLYPADIPTDESSLIAQYMYDTRMAKQVSAAVEAFWSQNKVIIESPLANSNATQTFGSNKLKNRLGTWSSSGGSLANRNNFSSPLNLDAKSNKKNHRYATSSVSSLSSLAQNNSATKLHETNKINKKDQNCQTMFSFPVDFDLNQIPELKEFLINPADCEKESSPKLNNSIRKKLFDPDELSSSCAKNPADDSFMSPRLRQLQKNFSKTNSEQNVKEARPAADLSFNEEWEDSFDFQNQASNANDKHHRSSSPKKNKNRKILCDMGSENEQDDDSVFVVEHRKLDLSPVGDHRTPKKIADLSSSDKMDLSFMSNSLFSKNLQHQHHNRIFHFDNQSETDKIDVLNSPNLSPISQKKSDLNSSSESQKSSQQQRSIIFMDFSKSSEKPRQNANKSFTIDNTDESNVDHNKREEIYNQMYHDTYENLIKKTEMQSRDINRTLLLQNSTITTINQSNSQDTGYQTNCFGQNGTNNSSNVTNASEMMLFKKPSSLNIMPLDKKNNCQNEKNELTDWLPSPDDQLKLNFDKMSKNLSKSCDKNESRKKQQSTKKFSTSLNSFETMQPIECSTPEKLKNELNNQFLFKSKTEIDFKLAFNENTSVFKVYDCSSRNNLDCSIDSDDNNYASKVQRFGKTPRDKNKLSSNCSMMEESILNEKSASEYARNIIDKAKQELLAASFYYNSKNTNRINRI